MLENNIYFERWLMIEDVLNLPNQAGKELSQILKDRRGEYEKYPEKLVLVKVLKEFLYNHNSHCANMDKPNELSVGECERIFELIYNSNTYRDMSDCFINKKTQNEYWKTLYSEDKYEQYLQSKHQKVEQKISKFLKEKYNIEDWRKHLTQQEYDIVVQKNMNNILNHTSPFILRPKTSNKVGNYEMYWERFHYDQGKETTWRVALNVLPEQELLEKIDAFARKYHCSWKYVNTTECYDKRTDPIIIYLPKETNKDKEKCLIEISQIASPYVRKDNYNVFGYENLGNGVFYGEYPTSEKLYQALLDCYDKEQQKSISKFDTYEEIKKYNESNLPHDTLQYFLAMKLCNPNKISGGELVILEWLNRVRQVAEKPAIFRNKDGSSVSKYFEITQKRDDKGRLLWRRTYNRSEYFITEKFDNFVEKIYPAGNKLQITSNHERD